MQCFFDHDNSTTSTDVDVAYDINNNRSYTQNPHVAVSMNISMKLSLYGRFTPVYSGEISKTWSS